jgi:septal ring factor EnvC (AmiA/AmiB activator)
MLGLGKYLTGGLGIGVAALGIVCSVQCTQIKAKDERITGLNDQIEARNEKIKNCATDMDKLRKAQDKVNEEIATLQAEAEKAKTTIDEANRISRELSRARNRLAEIEAERNEFEAELATLPRCEKYLATLLAIVEEEL